MTLKITLNIQKSNHTDTSETTVEKLCHTEIFLLITQKYVSYCYSRILHLDNHTETFKKIQRYPLPLFSQFSVFGFSVWFLLTANYFLSACISMVVICITCISISALTAALWHCNKVNWRCSALI